MQRSDRFLSFDKISAAIASTSAHAFLTAGLVTIVCVIALALATGLSGCAIERLATWDDLNVLDAAYRVVQGQTPHADFNVPLGPIYIWLIAAAMKLRGSNAESLPTALLFLVPFVSVLMWNIARMRFSALWTCVMTVFLTLLLVAPRNLGVSFDATQTSNALAYNRIAWALCCALFIQFGITRRDSAAVNAVDSSLTASLQNALRSEIIENVCAGIVLGILIFLKLPYGLVAAAFVAFSCVLNKQFRALPWIVSGFVLACFACMWGLHFEWGAFSRDMRALSESSSLKTRIYYVGRIVFGNLPNLVFEAICVLLISASLPVAWRERAKLVAFVCAITGCGLVLASVSFQWTEIPLIPVAFLVFAESVRRVRSDEPAAQTVRTPLVFLLALGMFMPTLATDASSLAYTFFLKRIHGVANAQYAHVETPSMSNLYVDQSRNAAEFDDARDGIDLLRREVHSAEPVAAFGASNPFPYIMGWPSPKGGSIAMGYGRTVSDKSHPSPEFMYGAPNFVLKPISPPETESARWLERTYGPYVNEHFEAIAASTFWRLYRRKTTNK